MSFRRLLLLSILAAWAAATAVLVEPAHADVDVSIAAEPPESGPAGDGKKEEEEEDEPGEDGDSGEAPEDGETSTEPETRSSGFTIEEEEQIERVFLTRQVKFPGERKIELVYDLEEEEIALGEDFLPDVKEAAKRMRWAGDYGEDHTSITGGLVVNRKGFWLHKTEWESAEIDITWGQLTEVSKKEDCVAAVFAFGKGRKKSFVGSNWGEQCVRLNTSLKFSARPEPAKLIDPPRAQSKLTFGLKVEDGVVTATKNGRPRATAKDSKITKKLSPGQVGIAWNGQYVQGIIPEIKITGRPTEKWLRENCFDKN